MHTLKLTKKYEKYPEYKDSGVEWLGKIPANWEAQKIVSVFNFSNQKVTEATHEPLSVTYDGIKRQIENAAKVAEGSLRKLVKVGDIAINGRSDRKGAVGMSEYEGGVSLVYNVLRKRDQLSDSKYFHYLFRSKLFSEEFYRWGRGIVDDLWTTRESEMKRICITVPKSQEQIKIAKYLDEKTSSVDQIIERKQKLIEFLKEKHIADINYAVTKGLDPKVELVESGVEWIDNIPKGWRVLPLKYVTEIQEGPGIMAEDFRETGVPLLRIKNLNNGFVDLEGSNFLDPEKVERKWSHFKLKQGDLLISGSASSGIVAEVTKEAVGSIAYTGLIKITSKSLDRYFLKCLLDSKYFNEQVEVQKAGTAMQHYGPTHLKKVVITIPPDDEQKKIADKVQKIKKIYLTSILNIEKSIELLQEFKSSLISNVVTGKIKI